MTPGVLSASSWADPAAAAERAALSRISIAGTSVLRLLRRRPTGVDGMGDLCYPVAPSSAFTIGVIRSIRSSLKRDCARVVGVGAAASGASESAEMRACFLCARGSGDPVPCAASSARWLARPHACQARSAASELHLLSSQGRRRRPPDAGKCLPECCWVLLLSAVPTRSNTRTTAACADRSQPAVMPRRAWKRQRRCYL